MVDGPRRIHFEKIELEREVGVMMRIEKGYFKTFDSISDNRSKIGKSKVNFLLRP
jgi:hypothetical protein